MNDKDPLICDSSPEDTALKIRSLLSLVELALSHEVDTGLQEPANKDRMYGCGIAIEIANQAIARLGEFQYHESNVAKLGVRNPYRRHAWG
jgi:hypothetical protein